MTLHNGKHIHSINIPSKGQQLLPEKDRERILQSDVPGIVINGVCASKKVRQTETDRDGGLNVRE